MGFEALAERYDLMKRQRVEQLGELRKRVLEELRRRNLKDFPTAKLVAILMNLDDRLHSELDGVDCKDGEDPSAEVLRSLGVPKTMRIA